MQKKTGKKRRDQEDDLEWSVEDLVRSDLLEHVRLTHSLWKNTLCASELNSDSALDITLSRAYACNTEVSMLVNLYQLATLACGNTECLGTDERCEVVGSCLSRVYGQTWPTIDTRSQRKLHKNILSRLDIGIVLKKLVAMFGSGILLMCSLHTISK